MADDFPPFAVTPLGKRDRDGFRSGEPEIDDWFHRRAGQDQRRDVARVFVAMDGEHIAGFYSLSAFSIRLSSMPEVLAAKLPRYGKIPAALIGRLARDERYRGRNIGALLLADAVRRTLNAAQDMAVHAIVVEAKNEGAVTFYRSFGFTPFVLHPSRLFLTTAAAAAFTGK